ncbi:MAG: inorganic phosphate transporter [Deltaproteobacteria bacterium]|nr:inorganic phosphate transporter [Deltaproteobacteria bacterium]
MHSTLLILATIFALYMAWNIGANDVANAMGTSVGSRALSFKQAIIVAAIFEFAGAVLVGSHVTGTIAKGIVSPTSYAANTFALGMVSSLLAAAIWLNIASRSGMPVSTTHSIVGAVMGFGIVGSGFSSIHWAKVLQIVLSWIISPLTGAIIAFLIFSFVKRLILQVEKPVVAAKKYAPYLSSSVILILSFAIFYKGLKNLHLCLSFNKVLLIALIISAITFFITKTLTAKVEVREVSYKKRYPQVERIFKGLQIMTACSMAFSHGANDVANAVGPLAGAVFAYKFTEGVSEVYVPVWVLGTGALGIVAGLATYGFRVIIVIGRKITGMNPSRGFSAELAAATTVLLCSRLGLPVSTTHTLVGAVIGVGLARGIASLNLKVIKDISLAWILTVPIAMVLSIVIYLILGMFFR